MNFKKGDKVIDLTYKDIGTVISVNKKEGIMVVKYPENINEPDLSEEVELTLDGRDTYHNSIEIRKLTKLEKALA